MVRNKTPQPASEKGLRKYSMQLVESLVESFDGDSVKVQIEELCDEAGQD